MIMVFHLSVTKTNHSFPISCGRLIGATLLIVTLSVLVTDSKILTAQSTTATPEPININVLPQSSPRLFNCQTPVNGTFPEINIDETPQSVLTDGDPDTGILGSAIFDVSSINGSSLSNYPGPDLKVVELRGAEKFNASVSNSNTGNNESISIRPITTNDKSACGHDINEALIDLSTFGVTNGSSVSSIRFDNLGVKDSLNGSDIAEVSLFKQEANRSSTDIAYLP